MRVEAQGRPGALGLVRPVVSKMEDIKVLPRGDLHGTTKLSSKRLAALRRLSLERNAQDRRVHEVHVLKCPRSINMKAFVEANRPKCVRVVRCRGGGGFEVGGA